MSARRTPSTGQSAPADGTSSTATDAPLDQIEEARRAFAEEFGLTWATMGSARMEGRILGYLLITDRPYLSSADLSHVLRASAGAISMATRRLLESGYIKRHVIPGDRNHYFTTGEDVWGSWLAGERRNLHRQRRVIEQGLDVVQNASGQDAAYRRLVNGRDYMIWLATYRQRMMADWEAYKHARDTGIGWDEP